MDFKTFNLGERRVAYRELATDRSDPFEKVYLLENPEQYDIVAIPDGCVDIQFVWRDGVCRGYVCGSFLHGGWSNVSTYSRCLGLKLRPGYRFRFLSADAAELMGARIPLSDFADVSALERRLCGADGFTEMAEKALGFFRGQESSAPCLIADRAANMILNHPDCSRVSEISTALGYSERYVNSIFKYYFGVPVKQYSGIIRAQNAIEKLRSGDVMNAVVDLGYYDQAHFIHDFKRYTCLTPNTFINLDRVVGGKAIV